MNFARRLRRRLADLIAAPASLPTASRGRLLLETLERRQMMAADVEMLFTEPTADAMTMATATSSTGSSSRAPQGEPGIDLVKFAQDLDAAGVTMYGAYWCPACTQQKQLFEDGEHFLPFVEVTRPDRTQDPQFASLNITQYPTWIFNGATSDFNNDGVVNELDNRLTGVQTLETLSQRSGVPIPTNTDERPFFAEIGNKTVRLGSPLHVPVDGYDPEGGPLTVTVTVANPDLLEAVVLGGNNRSLRLDMDGFGDMVFELFDDKAPVAAGRVATLAQNGFFNGIIFHRVVDGFVIQAGDPTGTGTSGSTLGNFDDNFHPDLQHTGPGVLSFAKAGDDTNNSQFFITEVPTQSLDYNHSVFGQLVEGADVREAISNMQVNGSDKPTTDVRINTATIFNDTENSVVMLKAKAASGSTTVTYTITDAQGNSYSEVTTVTLGADNVNAQPYLNPITTPAPATGGSPVTVQLSAVDLEQNPVTFFVDNAPATVTANVNATTGVLTVVPVGSFTGTANVRVGVRATTGAGTNSDTQSIPITFQSASTVSAPTSIDLQTASDNGRSTTDNRTSAASLTFDIAGVTTGATVQIINTSNNAVVGVGTATGSTISITTTNLTALGDGSYTLAARQTVNNVASSNSTPLQIVLDRTAPTLVRTGLPLSANVSIPYSASLVSSEAGTPAAPGTTFRLVTGPSGATVSSTGSVTWTPVTGQTGAQAFTVELSDTAGNTRNETFTVQTAGQPLASIQIRLTDLNDNPISSVAVGTQFKLVMVAVDTRASENIAGIFAAYADVLFDSTKVRAVPNASIEYGFGFGSLRKGTISAGLIDELGAVISFTQPTEDEESIIATIRMEAVAAGGVTFVSEPADGSGNDVLLFFNNNRVPAETVNYGTASLAIGQSFVGTADTISVTGTTPTTLNLLGNDRFVTGTGTLSILSVTQPASGGTVALSNGVVTFTANANGASTFNYVLGDGTGATQTVPVTVNVTGVSTDLPPRAVNDAFPVAPAQILEDAAQADYPVLTNDQSDASGQTFVISAVGQPSAGGTASIGPNGGTLRYQPRANFNGVETVSYTIRDSGGGTATALVTFTITAVNDAPPTQAVTKNAVKNESVIIRLSDLPANVDTGESLRFVNLGTRTAGGNAVISSDGSQITYTPVSEFTGTDTFTFQVEDAGGLRSAASTASIVVTEFTRRNLNIDLDGALLNTADQFQFLSLSGTDATGTAVAIPFANSDRVSIVNGMVRVAGLLPGQYSLSVPAIPFFENTQTARQIPINSAPTDGDANVDLSFGRLRAEYISVSDWFSTSPRRTLTAVLTPGGPSVAATPNAAASAAFNNLRASLNAQATTVTVTGTRVSSGTTAGASVSGSVSLSNSRAVQTRGVAGDSTGMRLVAINLDDTGVVLSNVTTPPATVSTNSVSGTGSGASSSSGSTPSGEPISSSRIASGEPISTLSSEQETPVVGGANSAEPTDAAMADVSSSMRLISRPGDAIAESSGDSPETFAEAVDRVLTDV